MLYLKLNCIIYYGFLYFFHFHLGFSFFFEEFNNFLNMVSTCLFSICFLLIFHLHNCECVCVFSSFFTTGRRPIYLSFLTQSTPSCQFHNPKSLLAVKYVGPTNGIFAAKVSSQIFFIPISKS